MTDRQIRCFLALYETLNFSAAARQLFLTQPTLSYQIRTLEEELGTPLFTRTTCRVEPTEAGHLFAAFAQSVRQSYQGFQQALAAGPTRHGLGRPNPRFYFPPVDPSARMAEAGPRCDCRA